MKTQFDSYKGIGLVLVIIILIIYLIYENATKYKAIEPRKQNGKGYMYSQDSVYKISFTIDTVFAKEYEPED
jgi:hypothetical protein